MAELHEQLLQLWALSMTVQSLSPNTISGRLINVRAFLRAAATEDLATIRKLDLLTYLAQPGWSAGTRATYQSSLSSFFRWCVDEGHLEHDPSAHLPRVRVRAAEPNPTETDGMQRLLDSGIRGHTITKVLLYAYEGGSERRRSPLSAAMTGSVAGSGSGMRRAIVLCSVRCRR